MTLDQKRNRNEQIVARVQTMQRRNIPRVASEFQVSEVQVYRILRAAGVPTQRTEARI